MKRVEKLENDEEVRQKKRNNIDKMHWNFFENSAILNNEKSTLKI